MGYYSENGSDGLLNSIYNGSNTQNNTLFTRVFGTNRFVEGSKEFLQSNTYVAKFTFLFLIIILFIIALKAGTGILQYIFGIDENPILVDGVKDGKMRLDTTIPIVRSKNESEGIEFTYSTWLFIDDLVYKKGQKKHIFSKGSTNLTDGMAYPNNAPGLYLDEEKNKLHVIMSTFENIKEEIEIDNIPMHKWFNVVIRVKNKYLDVYINGNIAVRKELSSVPKQNYGNVVVNMNNGFSGKLSSLRYFNRALTGTEINNLIHQGPNMKMDKSLNIFPPYLSMRWFLFKTREGPVQLT